MAAQPKGNYTEDMVARILSDYEAGIDLETIAESVGKTVRSVRSKLVREGVYVAQPKAVRAKRDEGPTKKEMLRTLEALAPFPVEGLMGATKAAISDVIAYLQSQETAEVEEVQEA